MSSLRMIIGRGKSMAEARRMVSRFVMTELHLRGIKETKKSVGMGSYNMDSHNVQRYVAKDDQEIYVLNEGDIQVNPGSPYQISYDSMVPKIEECINLLVPVCISSSHIAFGSIRMEPVFMILAQSAATAAVWPSMRIWQFKPYPMKNYESVCCSIVRFWN